MRLEDLREDQLEIQYWLDRARKIDEKVNYVNKHLMNPDEWQVRLWAANAVDGR